MKLTNNIYRTGLIVFTFLHTLNIISQENEAPKPIINWNITSQIWMRYSELNEGSNIYDEPAKEFFDVSIRRLRIPISSQVTPKIYTYAILGGNNYNYKTDEFPINILDLYVEYKFDQALEVGFGKSGWQGLNRWNIRSTSNSLTLDSPLFTLNSVEINDDIGRLFGVWLKGQAGKFDYRLALNRPFAVSNAPNGKVDFANNKPRVKTSTYVKYQFFENESNKSAYQVGTYMQSKKVFNIGVGYQYLKNATSDGDTQLAGTTLYDMKHFAADSFLNLPLSNGNAITAYLGFYDYDFGKDYIRNVGINNPTTSGGTDFNGHGIAFPMIGTGTTWYGQFGYAFKQTNLLNHQVIIQPSCSIQYSNWDALNDKMMLFDANINFCINGSHDNKITLGYQHRPIFDAITLEQKDYKGMAVLQYQISFK